MGRMARYRVGLNSQYLGELCDLLELTIVPGIGGERVFPPLHAE